MSATPPVDSGRAGELTDWLAAVEPVGLDTLNRTAALQRRIDRKYLVPIAAVGDLLADTDAAGVLDIAGCRSFRYTSWYFDTPRHDFYLAAAHRRRRRFKVRTRLYVDTDWCMIEVKAKGRRGETVKQRAPQAVECHGRLSTEAASFVGDQLGGSVNASDLQPVLATEYQRSTVVDSAGVCRLTIDTDLRVGARRNTAAGTSDRYLDLFTGFAIVESKSPGHLTTFDRWLSRNGYRPQAVSKFCIGVATLHPDLPHNKWSRAIRLDQRSHAT